METKQAILCLDFDDALIPNPNTWFGRIEDAQDILRMNMKRIKNILESCKNMKVFITSSWYSVLEINEDGGLEYERAKAIEEGSSFLLEEYISFTIIRDAIGNRVIGLSSGDRIDDINTLIHNGNLVIAIDDMDLSKDIIWFNSDNVDKPLVDKNYLFLETHGFLTNRILFKLHKFLESHNELIFPI